MTYNAVKDELTYNGNLVRWFDHGIPKMAHAELVLVHPELFDHYAEKFLKPEG